MNYIHNQPVKRDWVNRTKRMLDKAAPYLVALLAIACGFVLLYAPEIVTNGF